MNIPTHSYIALLISLVFLFIVGCGEEPDTVGPRVTRTAPRDKAMDVSLDAIIEVGFDERIDPSSIEGAVEVSPVTSGIVTCSKRAQTLIFEPSEGLSPGTEYVIKIRGIMDTAGNEMGVHTFRFTTGERDTNPPRVIETIPVPDEEDVSEEIEYIIIEFSEKLDRIRAGGAFHVRGDISGEMGLDARWLDMVTYELELDSDLENEDRVTVRIDKSCIADTAGNEMMDDYVFSFTVEGINPVGRPKEYVSRVLSYSIWQTTGGEWHIRWNANWMRGAPPRYSSPSQPPPKPKPKPPPKRPPLNPQAHYFSGRIVGDGTIMATIDPYSFSDGDLIQTEVRGNLVKITGDEVIVERDEANTVTVTADVITVDGDIGDMVTVTEDTVTVTGDIVTVVESIVTIEGNVLAVNGDEVTVKGDGGSVIVVEGSVLNVEGNVIILDGEITSLTGSAIVVAGDVVVVQGNKIWFAGFTGIGDSGDGVDFKSDGVYLTFDIKIDNEYMKDNVFIGGKSKHPQNIPFELKSRFQYDGP